MRWLNLERFLWKNSNFLESMRMKKKWKIGEILHNNDSKGFLNKVKGIFFKITNDCIKIENSVAPSIIAEKFLRLFEDLI